MTPKKKQPHAVRAGQQVLCEKKHCEDLAILYGTRDPAMRLPLQSSNVVLRAEL